MQYLSDNIEDPIIFFTTLIISNILMFSINIFISNIWNKHYNLKTKSLKFNDVLLAVFVAIFINVIVAIPGYYLFLNNEIQFTDTNFLRDFILLFLSIDILMFLLHISSHFVYPFKKMHQKHHSHQNFNAFSLYVMHPFEAVAFGLLLTIIPFLITLNIYSFLLFIFLNWFLGVVAHLNTDSKKDSLFFGNNVFHQNHHKYGNYNFGFYTIVWDKIFGTFYKS